MFSECSAGRRASQIVNQYQSPWLRGYVRAKLKTDPVYGAVLRALGDSQTPLLDLGCGVGLLPFYLLANGSARQITGVDFDSRKIEEARRVAHLWEPPPRFIYQDARTFLEFKGDVVILDLLHYFTDHDQQAILTHAAGCVAPGRYLIIRDCLKDRSLRYKLTYLEEWFATSINWLKAERLNFPTRQAIVAPLEAQGFSVLVEPLSGRLPFNNHLLTFRAPHVSAPAGGMTQR